MLLLCSFFLVVMGCTAEGCLVTNTLCSSTSKYIIHNIGRDGYGMIPWASTFAVASSYIWINNEKNGACIMVSSVSFFASRNMIFYIRVQVYADICAVYIYFVVSYSYAR